MFKLIWEGVFNLMARSISLWSWANYLGFLNSSLLPGNWDRECLSEDCREPGWSGRFSVALVPQCLFPPPTPSLPARKPQGVWPCLGLPRLPASMPSWACAHVPGYFSIRLTTSLSTQCLCHSCLFLQFFILFMWIVFHSAWVLSQRHPKTWHPHRQLTSKDTNLCISPQAPVPSKSAALRDDPSVSQTHRHQPP